MVVIVIKTDFKLSIILGLLVMTLFCKYFITLEILRIHLFIYFASLTFANRTCRRCQKQSSNQKTDQLYNVMGLNNVNGWLCV